MLAPARQSNAANIGFLIALALLWGGSYMVIKIAVASVPAASVTAGRLLIAATVVLIFALLRGQSLPRTLAAWRWYLAVGMLGNCLPFTLIAWGEVAIDSGLAAILMAVTPLSTLILAHFFAADEPLSLRRLGGVLLGFAGIVILIGPSALDGLGDDAIRQGAVALGAVCYAGAYVAVKYLPSGSSVTNSAGVLIAAALTWLPVAIFIDRPWTLTPTAASLASIVVLGLLPTALATLIYLNLIRRAGATFVSLSNFLVPLVGVFFGAWFLAEEITARAVLVLVLVLAGIALARQGRANVQPRKRKSR